MTGKDCRKLICRMGKVMDVFMELVWISKNCYSDRVVGPVIVLTEPIP